MSRGLLELAVRIDGSGGSSWGGARVVEGKRVKGWA